MKLIAKGLLLLAALGAILPASAQTISGPTIQAFQSSLALPAGQTTYIYGMTTGGADPSSPFSQGNYQSVTDVGGQLSAALAMTSSNSDSFTTNCEYYVIGGVAVSGFTGSPTASYGSNTQSGASQASDTFSITQNSLVVFVGLASSQQSISLTGIPGLHVDARSGEPEAMIIAHANLSPGTYTATEHSKATAAGQNANNMADLLGVFVFTNSSVAHNTWSSGARMPVALDGTAVAVLENEIYVVGGDTTTGAPVANVQIYDPTTNAWSKGVPLPKATGGGCAGVVNNDLYFIGGNIGGPGVQDYTDAVWAYSPMTKKWSKKTPMPTTAEAGALCVVEKGIIYVMGGYGDSSFLATVEGFDPATNKWTEPQQLQPMLSAEDTVSAGLIGTTIVVTDGSDNYVDGHNQGYDVPTNTWRWLTSDPTLRQCTCGGSIGGRLYSAGGWDDVNSAALTLTESFTLSTGDWKTLAPMPQGTMFGIGGSVAYKGRLYCLGGQYSTGGNVVNTVQIYQP